MRRKVAKILDMQAAEIDPHTYKREGRRVCARGMEGSGEISSFELQFMHIPRLRIYCWKLLFSLSTLYMGPPIPVFRDDT